MLVKQEIYELLKQHKIEVQRFKLPFYHWDNPKELFIEAFEYVINEKMTWISGYNQVIEWMSDNENKGIALFGGVGTGKSVILNGIMPILFAMKDKILVVKAARDIKEFSKQWCYAVDDIGTEPMISDYGMKYYPIEQIIDYCEQNGKLLLMSSNFTSSQLNDKYGARVVDRIESLCKIVEFKGKSLRK